jgi:hypothetical protein
LNSFVLKQRLNLKSRNNQIAKSTKHPSEGAQIHARRPNQLTAIQLD